MSVGVSAMAVHGVCAQRGSSSRAGTRISHLRFCSLSTVPCPAIIESLSRVSDSEESSSALSAWRIFCASGVRAKAGLGCQILGPRCQRQNLSGQAVVQGKVRRKRPRSVRKRYDRQPFPETCPLNSPAYKADRFQGLSQQAPQLFGRSMAANA